MGHKVVETTCKINNAFGPGIANKHTVQWWFKKFCKGDGALKMRSVVGGHRKLTTANGEQSLANGEKIIEDDLLTTIREVAEEIKVDHSMVIQHLKQIRKMKNLDE
ncbi:hypothetical protein AV530_018837 [Patagioenas fasciata monilis]|uniref:Mos1 transposase HTH domain-containing protein n=1 Tax=Patagioenas fasciata monilis TaxID=372326 RepID=A0A1V4JJP7_PATFA|nr:hypothetical protein AV530_018837 [Patagioenas fasciata monilis]